MDEELLMDVEPAAEGPSDQDAGVFDEQALQLRAARLRRAADFQVEALANRDCLAANLGGIAGSLMGVCVCLDSALTAAMAAESPLLGRMEKLAPDIEILLRITRQLDRLAQLDLQLNPRQRPAAKNGRGHCPPEQPGPAASEDPAT